MPESYADTLATVAEGRTRSVAGDPDPWKIFSPRAGMPLACGSLARAPSPSGSPPSGPAGSAHQGEPVRRQSLPDHPGSRVSHTPGTLPSSCRAQILPLAPRQRLAFDPRAAGQDRRLPSPVHVRRGHVLQRLVQPAVVVVLDEVPDRPRELPRTVVHVELHDVLPRPVIAFDLPLRHRVIRRPARWGEPVLREVAPEGLRHVARAVVAEEPRPDARRGPDRPRPGRARDRASPSRRLPASSS